jgi:hypothetical protein
MEARYAAESPSQRQERIDKLARAQRRRTPADRSRAANNAWETRRQRAETQA